MDEGRIIQANSKPFAVSIQSGQVLRFVLRANPTKKKDGTRIPYIRAEEQIGWLRRKGEQHGFSVLEAMIAEAVQMKSAKRGNGRQITHYGVDFQGRLQVEHAALFDQAIRTGIGPAKGFGFGMLCVAR